MVYPTLTNGMIRVETPQTKLTAPLRVLDMAGRLVLKLTDTAGQQAIDLGHLPRGRYFVAVPLAQGTVIKRIMKY